MKIFRRVSYVLILLIVQFHLIHCSFSLGLTIFGALGAALYQNYERIIGCKVAECCKQGIGTGWIPANITVFKESIQHKLYGQHLVDRIVTTALIAHFSDDQPSKALVMSFHGWTGSGKNYVAKFIADALYYKGLESNYAHLYVSTVSFPHEDQVDIYKLQIQDWIRGNVSKCARSLFIFDEIDKMPLGMIDAIKPFIDYHEKIFEIDFRKSIFIFLSNTGGVEINKKMLELWRQGRERLSVTMSDIEPIAENGAFNEKGGLHKSDLIHRSLIDHFVPFLPLERRHIEGCIRDEIIRRRRKPTQIIINKVMESLAFFPVESPVFSNTGCKRISTKVGFTLADEKYESLFD